MVSEFYFRGGDLALDFLNTVGNRRSAAKRRDYFALPPDVLLWAKAAGVRVAAEAKPGLKQADLQRVQDFREPLYRVFRAQVEGKEPRADDVVLLNRTLRTHRRAMKLVRRGDGFAWLGKLRWVDALLGVVAEAAAELLTSQELGRMRICANEDCGWLFLDHSRSRPRKWCSMEDCGNRAKQRRFQEKNGQSP